MDGVNDQVGPSISFNSGIIKILFMIGVYILPAYYIIHVYAVLVLTLSMSLRKH